MLTTSVVRRGHSDAANRSTGSTLPVFAVRLAPAERPRPLRGRRGVRAAPPHVPHPCSLCPYFVCRTRHRRTRLTKWTGRHCARGYARPSLAYGRPLRCDGRAWACGAVAPQPGTWGGVSSGAWQLDRDTDLQRWWHCSAGAHLYSALARRAGPGHCRVVDCALRAALHPFIALRRDGLRGALRGERGRDDAPGAITFYGCALDAGT
jgi:hypothetical protein